MLNNAPAAAPKRLVVLPYGVLPVLSYFRIVSGLAPDEARKTLALMRRGVKALGATNAIHELLKAHGFCWQGLRVVEPVEMHDGTHADCRLCESNRRWEVLF
ncbi:MAG: hypothetical protein IPJ65_42685 [Archangiaceae bacterium]|nr:hypothetical protein [Archangiaceae bacterium]